MNIKNIFFHIHYCNGRKVTAQRNYPGQVARTLNHHLLALVIEGNGRIIIDKKSFRLKSGMLCYIAPNVQHSIEPDPENPARFLTVHFSYTYVNYSDGKWDINDSPQILPLNPVQEITDGYNTENIFKRLVDTWNTKQPGYEFLSKTLFQQLLIAIYQNVRKQTRNYSTSLKVEKVIQHMYENMCSKITITELSEMVNLSPAYLSKAFRETTEYSVIEYFNKIKIDKAKELLIEGDKKVKQVAESVGFKDEFYFSRIFKKIEGVSPSEYCNRFVHGV